MSTRRLAPMVRRARSLAAFGMLVAGAIFFAPACGDDEAEAPGALDASTDRVTEDVDPCNRYTRVGESCNLPVGRICFAQCANGGCFCEKGLWACRTDLSCIPEAGPLDDSGTAVDANVDADTDAATGDGGDAGLDASDLDASDASDAPVSDASLDDAADGALIDAGAD